MSCHDLQNELLGLDAQIEEYWTVLRQAEQLRKLNKALDRLEGLRKDRSPDLDERLLGRELLSLVYRREKLRERLMEDCGGDCCHTGVKLANPEMTSFPVPLTPADVHEATRSATICFASGERRDGVGDVLEVEGIDTSRHRLSPIVLLEHGKVQSLPIGICEDPQGRYTVHIDPLTRRATARVYFNSSPMGSRVFDLVKAKQLRAGSIGYRILKGRHLPPDPETGTPAGLHLLSVELLEVSVVGIPANPLTVTKGYTRSRRPRR